MYSKGEQAGLNEIIHQSGQALFTPLKLRSEGLVPATAALRACVTSTSLSSARQTFPSGLWPYVKDCFWLHGHSAFGSVAKDKSGVGRLSATSGVQTTDLVHWLQAGKTVDISRSASESTDLLPPYALLRQQARLLPGFSPPGLRPPPFRGALLPLAAVACSIPTLPPCGMPTSDVSPLTRTCHLSGFQTPVGCADIPPPGEFAAIEATAPLIVLPLRMLLLMLPVVMSSSESSRSASTGVGILLLVVLLYIGI